MRPMTGNGMVRPCSCPRRQAKLAPGAAKSRSTRIEGLSGEIEALAQQDQACLRLMTVPGIGPIISSAMVAAIGTGDVFCKGRDFGAWLGLVPKQISTGDRTILGSISKRGNRYLRALFVQAAWVVLVKLGPKHWERYGLKSWIEAAKKRLHHNVLAIALANKLARIAWAVLNKGRAFACVKTRGNLHRPSSARYDNFATPAPNLRQDEVVHRPDMHSGPILQRFQWRDRSDT
jgi:Transposase IS116/IS110/IS902 family